MNYNLYIKGSGHSYDLILKNQIIVEKNKILKCTPRKFYTLNSMYNVSETYGNNTFTIERRTLADVFVSTILITVPSGNYSVLTLRDTLNTLLTGIASIGYNASSNTYLIVKTDASYKYIIKNIKCPKLIGLTNDTEITTIGVRTSFLNMVDYTQIIVMSDLTHLDLNQDNILVDDRLGISQILLQVQKGDVQPFEIITYENNDISYNLTNNNITKIGFKIMNEDGEFITDIGEWYLHLHFELVNKNDDWKILIVSLMKLLKDIKYLFLYYIFSASKSARP